MALSYPGYDIFIDPKLNPAPSRIAYGGGTPGPVFDADSADVACNTVHSPAPGFIAEARAGSDISFSWSRWLYSHKGPITAWMAPYEGDVADVNVNELEFFKFAEEAVDANGIWGTVKLLDETNGTWTASIPADIKPGTYIIRQEVSANPFHPARPSSINRFAQIIALHFAVNTTAGFGWAPIGPQFYMTCFSFNITGDGTATPQGFKFPGAYDKADPALNWDLTSTDPYPMAGPDLYVSSYDAELEPKQRVVISPTGTNNATADEAYYQAQYEALVAQGEMTSYFDSIGG